MISTIGDNIFATTILLWITQRLAARQPWTPLAVSGELIASTLPTILFGPFAGVFVDRWDKRRTMVCMDLVRSGILLTLVPLAISAASLTSQTSESAPFSVAWRLGALYVTLAIIIACTQFFNPARLGLIGDLVPVEQQARASSLVFMTLSLGIVIGPALAAWLFFATGPAWALVFDGFSFLASFAAIRSIQTNGNHSPPAQMSKRSRLADDSFRVAQSNISGRSAQPPPQRTVGLHLGNFLGEFISGVRYFWSNRILRTLVIVTSITLFGASAINTLGIFFLTTNLQRPAQWYGLLETATGVGVLVGSIGATWLVPRLGVARSFWLGTAFTGLLLMLYAGQTNYGIALALLIAIGLPSAGLNVAIGLLLLQAAPANMTGRMVAQFVPTTNLAALLSTAFVGYLATTALRHFHLHILAIVLGPYDTIYLLGGFIIACSSLYAWVGIRSSIHWPNEVKSEREN